MITDGFIWHFKFSAWTKMHQSCDHVNSKKSIFLNPVLINKPQLKNHQDLVPRFHLNMILMSLILHFIVKILKLQRDNGIKLFYMTENIKWHIWGIEFVFKFKFIFLVVMRTMSFYTVLMQWLPSPPVYPGGSGLFWSCSFCC